MNHEHPLPFTKKVSDEMLETMIEQDKFGLKKYNKPLDPMDVKYDWLKMAEQEIADMLKYFKAEQVRRDAVLEDVLNDLNLLESNAKQRKSAEFYLIQSIKLKLMQLSHNL